MYGVYLQMRPVRPASRLRIEPAAIVFAALPPKPLKEGGNAALIGSADAGSFNMQRIAGNLADGDALAVAQPSATISSQASPS